MKRILTFLLALTMILSLCACGTVKETEKETSAEAVQTEYPLTVTDQAGRSVTIEAEPQRLVSGYYISTSLLIALDLDQKLVGVEAKADKRAIYKLSAPALIELPNVGTAKEFDLEGCLALNPDLVILPIKLKSAAETLEQMNIDVILVNPESQALLNEMIKIVSKATNSQDRAEMLFAFTAAREAMLAEKLENATKPRVYLAGNSALLSTAGNAMYQHSMIGAAGGANVAGDIADTYWVNIDYEQLLAWDPEYIILASDASYTCEDVLKDPNLANCRAVKEGKVYQMPNVAEAWDSPVPSGVLGSVWLASVLHSELISAEEAQDTITKFYEQFYGFAYPHA